MHYPALHSSRTSQNNRPDAHCSVAHSSGGGPDKANWMLYCTTIARTLIAIVSLAADILFVRMQALALVTVPCTLPICCLAHSSELGLWNPL